MPNGLSEIPAPAAAYQIAGDVLSQGLLLVFFLLALLVFAAISAALVYHWRTYEFDHPKINRMMRMYFIGVGILFLVMLIAIFSFPK